MARPVSTVILPGRIQELLDQRAGLIAALERIDGVLSKVGSVLGGRTRGRKPSILTEAAPVRKGKKRGRRRGRKFGMSGEESIIAFIKQNKNPTTQDVNKYWKSLGRGGTADNSLSKLVREKQLKRQPLVGTRGSSYVVL